jgi:hypothetical protein
MTQEEAQDDLIGYEEDQAMCKTCLGAISEDNYDMQYLGDEEEDERE